MKTLYIIWQDTKSRNRMWSPVAKVNINTNQEVYSFQYTNGSKNPNFIPFPRMQDLSEEFFSPRLFPFLKNRMFPKNRPEFNEFLDWTGSKQNIDPLDLLILLGGNKATDNYRVIMQPTPKDGYYIQDFFVSGIQYIDEKAKEYIDTIKEGECLLIKYDDDNTEDKNAVMLISTTGGLKLGYYPAYLNFDLRKLLRSEENPNKQCKVKVLKNNLDAPSQYRLFCRLETKWPPSFQPCSSEQYQVYSKS